MKFRILPLIVFLMSGGAGTAFAAFTAPNGLSYNYRVVSLSYVETTSESELYQNSAPPEERLDEESFRYILDYDSSARAVIHVSGPGGDSWGLATKNVIYDNSVKYGGIEDECYNYMSETTVRSTHTSSTTGVASMEYNDSNGVFSFTPLTYVETPGGPISPSMYDLADPSTPRTVTTDSGAGTCTVVSTEAPTITPDHDVDSGSTANGEWTREITTLYYRKSLKTVIYTNTAPATPTVPGTLLPIPDTGDLPPGYLPPVIPTPDVVTIGGVVIPQDGYYGTSDLSKFIYLETSGSGPVTWRCVGTSVSYEDGEPISPSDYTITPNSSGALFTTSVPGTYEFAVNTPTGISHFTVVMGAPEVSSLDLRIFVWEADQYITAEPSGFELEPGTYHFEVIPDEYLFFSDYSLPYEPHWAFSSGATSQLVDGNDDPNPNGPFLKVTITTPGLYVISASVTSPVFPEADSPDAIFDLLVE